MSRRRRASRCHHEILDVVVDRQRQRTEVAAHVLLHLVRNHVVALGVQDVHHRLGGDDGGNGVTMIGEPSSTADPADLLDHRRQLVGQCRRPSAEPRGCSSRHRRTASVIGGVVLRGDSDRVVQLRRPSCPGSRRPRRADRSSTSTSNPSRTQVPGDHLSRRQRVAVGQRIDGGQDVDPRRTRPLRARPADPSRSNSGCSAPAGSRRSPLASPVPACGCVRRSGCHPRRQEKSCPRRTGRWPPVPAARRIRRRNPVRG